MLNDTTRWAYLQSASVHELRLFAFRLASAGRRRRVLSNEAHFERASRAQERMLDGLMFTSSWNRFWTTEQALGMG